MAEIKYQEQFARLDRTPSKTLFLIFLLYSLFKGSEYRANLLRTFYVSRISQNPLNLSLVNAPKIKIVINSTDKDFALLPLVIKYAVKNSINPISSIEIAVPDRFVQNCRSLLSKSRITDIKIEIVSEDNFLSERIREKIRLNFPNRYGWVLQQFLTLDRVLKSEFPVLQVNSDTLLLRKKIWVDQFGNQEIQVSSEFHKPYYQLLEKIGIRNKSKNTSHITHHMLFQPELLSGIFSRIEVADIESLLDLVILYADKEIESPMCVEFELYALGVQNFFPTRVEFVKFGNISWKKPENFLEDQLESRMVSFSKMYNSISLHSYL